MAIVYGLRDKKKKEYFYIGCTRKSVHTRLSEHLAMIRTGYKKNRHFVNKVNKIGVSNIVADVIEVTSNGMQFEREEYWIKYFLGIGYKLVNIVHNTISPDIFAKIGNMYSFERNQSWINEWYEQYKSTGVFPLVAYDEEYSDLISAAQFELLKICDNLEQNSTF